jgi:hypothetical protein
MHLNPRCDFPDPVISFPHWDGPGMPDPLKCTPVVALRSGTLIVIPIPVFHRILELKHGPDFYPAFFCPGGPALPIHR